MDAFDAAVSSAFGQKPSTEAQQPMVVPPQPESFENDFHGKQLDPKPIPLKMKKPKKSRRADPLTGDPLPPPPPKKVRKIDMGDPLDRQDVYGMITRYADAFPEEAPFHEVGHLNPEEVPLQELEFVLHRIQRRINAKQELQLLQSGLVTSCMCVEMVSDMVPGNPVKLQGFGQNVNAQISMFDNVLKQIACKYGGNVTVSVEAQLGMLLLRVAGNTHFMNLKAESEQENKDKPKPVLEEDGVFDVFKKKDDLPPPPPPEVDNNSNNKIDL